MYQDGKIWVGQGENSACLLLNQANRHGIITGASGTGKTVTLKVIAEGFSKAGVPVFLADVKGDVTGMCQPGEDSENVRGRAEELGATSWVPEGCPCRFWDMLGSDGCPVRITVSDMGPTLLSRLLGLTQVQEGVLDIAFRVADDKQLLLIDLKDLRAMLNYVSEHAREFETVYGKVSSQSVGAILRALVSIEDQGGDVFFGEPALELSDWFATDAEGRGYVNILNASKLMQSPKVYAMFLLWMITELFESMPEVGDLDKPKFVFFFDEAHLLFDDMPKELVDKTVQLVKLIRSKGVGVYFITQSPGDIPDEVLAQLSNRVQHGLRAYTPAEQKVVRAAAESFRENPAFDTEQAIMELGTGEALVSFLNEKGQPEVVDKVKILPPQCLMGAAARENVDAVLNAEAELMGKYATAIDRESAFEKITQENAENEEAEKLAAERAALEKEKAEFEKKKAAEEEKAERKAQREAERAAAQEAREQQKREERAAREIKRAASSIMGTFGRELTRQITRSILGTRRR
ncbi:MAG: helicase HerA-like domain-containing protein [Coriobacteriales bacterium]|jgi:DNA helicase HerA-like ATPase